MPEVKELLQRKLQQTIYKLYLRLGRTLPLNNSSTLVAEANMQAKRNYTPQFYPGQITLFSASEPPVFTKLYLPTPEDWYNRDPQHGWGELTGEVLIHDVNGDHFSIFFEPHVRVLAEKLKACLDSAETNNQEHNTKRDFHHE